METNVIYSSSATPESEEVNISNEYIHHTDWGHIKRDIYWSDDCTPETMSEELELESMIDADDPNFAFKAKLFHNSRSIFYRLKSYIENLERIFPYQTFDDIDKVELERKIIYLLHYYSHDFYRINVRQYGELCTELDIDIYRIKDVLLYGFYIYLTSDSFKDSINKPIRFHAYSRKYYRLFRQFGIHYKVCRQKRYYLDADIEEFEQLILNQGIYDLLDKHESKNIISLFDRILAEENDTGNEFNDGEYLGWR